ncbi:MAG: sugar phosphate nucleotidyltransferase [Chitinophagaceae bacterium]|nr:sugar phosphate nucleotidyltransferase [Chitinophagaceae bacterium]
MKQPPALVILAAGMASRYGSMKQTEHFGPNGETIIDYSLYDAIQAGFGKVIFVVREQFKEEFRKLFEEKLKGKIQSVYVTQELDRFINGYPVPQQRTKPWGTAHAVLCAQEAAGDTFAVINADDFYGRDAFLKSLQFLKNECSPQRYALIGYELKNTLSEHGAVNRGICFLNAQGRLISIVERINILKDGNDALCEDGKEPSRLPMNTKVSMNFWCFHSSYFSLAQKMFHHFLEQESGNLKSEFFIPIVADAFLKNGGVIDVLPTASAWFGVTYREDASAVRDNIRQLVEAGEYPEKLW